MAIQFIGDHVYIKSTFIQLKQSNAKGGNPAKPTIRIGCSAHLLPPKPLISLYRSLRMHEAWPGEWCIGSQNCLANQTVAYWGWDHQASLTWHPRNFYQDNYISPPIKNIPRPEAITCCPKYIHDSQNVFQYILFFKCCYIVSF